MTAQPVKAIPFGSYLYDHETRQITHLQSQAAYSQTEYMSLRDGKWTFTDFDLAANLFQAETSSEVIPKIRFHLDNDTPPRWAAVQLALPLIEIAGKLMDAPSVVLPPLQPFGKAFKRGAVWMFPRDSLGASISDADYGAVIDTLYHGLRCGLLHTGFVEGSSEMDVQVLDGMPALSFFDTTGSGRVLEIGSEEFVEKVCDNLAQIATDLANGVLSASVQSIFLASWQRRWGTFAEHDVR